MDAIVHNLNQQAASSSREAQSRIAGIQNAQLVTRYYETPIVRPTYPPASNEQPPRVNYRELLMLTGYFDPNDKATDFKHVWQKLNFFYILKYLPGCKGLRIRQFTFDESF